MLNLKDSMDEFLSRVSRDKRRRLRQVAEAGFSFEVTRDLVKLRSFYYDMYLPHMLKRHSKYALPISFSECLDLFSRGELLLVKSGEELISGDLLVPYEDKLHSPVMGVTDVEKYLTLGSFSAYYFSILLGIQRGYAKMDFGETPPFMNDGLFQFKKDLDMWVKPASGDSAQVFGIRFPNKPVSINGFLSAHPIIIVNKEKLSGLVFLGSIDDSSIKRFYVSGIESLYVVSTSPEVSDLRFFKSEKLMLEKYLNEEIDFMRMLSKFCTEGNYFLYCITQ